MQRGMFGNVDDQINWVNRIVDKQKWVVAYPFVFTSKRTTNVTCFRIKNLKIRACHEISQ